MQTGHAKSERASLAPLSCDLVLPSNASFFFFLIVNEAKLAKQNCLSFSSREKQRNRIKERRTRDTRQGGGRGVPGRKVSSIDNDRRTIAYHRQIGCDGFTREKRRTGLSRARVHANCTVRSIDTGACSNRPLSHPPSNQHATDF